MTHTCECQVDLPAKDGECLICRRPKAEPEPVKKLTNAEWRKLWEGWLKRGTR